MISEEILKAAFREAAEQEIAEIEEETKDTEDLFQDAKFKRKMNRLFRERLGITKIPHPEVDSAYERMRSRFVRLWFIIFQRRDK